MPSLKTHHTGMVLAGGGMVLISIDSLGIRLSDAEPWDVAFWLGAFAFIAMVVVVPISSGVSLLKAARLGGWPIALSSLFTAASLTFFVMAVSLTTVANTVIIIGAVPVVAALIAHLVIGERTTLRTRLAIALSFTGVWTVVSGSLGSGRLSGDLLAVLAILAFSSNLTLWRRFPELNRMVIIGLGGLTAAVVALIAGDPLTITPRGLAILAVVGLGTGLVGRLMVATSPRYLPVARVGLFTPIETVAATGWAWIFLSEQPGASTIVGGLIVISAVLYGASEPEPKLAQ